MLKQVCFVFSALFGFFYMGVHSQELKNLTHELEVKVPASEVWELYRHLGISKLAAEQLKNAIKRIEVLKGDGGIGTVLKITIDPGNYSYTEKFSVIDDNKRVKVAEGLEGGCLAIGCSEQIIRFDIIEKSSASSIVKSNISYAAKKEFEGKDPRINIELLAAAVIQLLASVAQVAKNFLESNH